MSRHPLLHFQRDRGQQGRGLGVPREPSRPVRRRAAGRLVGPRPAESLLCGGVPPPGTCVASPRSWRASAHFAGGNPARQGQCVIQASLAGGPSATWRKSILVWSHRCPPGGRGCQPGQGLPGQSRHLRWGARTCRPLGWEVRAGSGPRGGSGGPPGLCGPCSHPLRLPEPPRVGLGIRWGGAVYSKP